VHPDQARARKSKVHFQFKLSASYPITRPANALVAVNATPVIIPYCVFERPRSLTIFEKVSPLFEFE